MIVALGLALLYLTPVGGFAGESAHLTSDLMAAAVGLSILIMVVFNTEHPPAAGTVLGLAVEGWTLSAVFFVLLGAVMLSVVHGVLRPRLVNLF